MIFILFFDYFLYNLHSCEIVYQQLISKFNFYCIGEFIWDKSKPEQFPDVVFGSEDEDFLPDFESYKVKPLFVHCLEFYAQMISF